MLFRSTTPGAMALSRDMLADVPLLANLATIHKNRQQLVDEGARRENAKRSNHALQAGGKASMASYGPAKLEPRAHGPCMVTQVLANGTAKIQLDGAAEEVVSIRKLFPHKESNLAQVWLSLSSRA